MSDEAGEQPEPDADEQDCAACVAEDDPGGSGVLGPGEAVLVLLGIMIENDLSSSDIAEQLCEEHFGQLAERCEWELDEEPVH